MLFEGLSVGVEGGINQYLATRLDYESEFDDTLMDFILVHLMLIEKCDSLPLGLAHDGCTLYCHLGFLHFGSAQRDGHGSELHLVRYAHMNL